MMISVTQPTQIPSIPTISCSKNSNHTNPSSLFFLPANNRTTTRSKCKCSATNQPQPQQRTRKKTQQPEVDKRDGVDPVEFLTKHIITNKTFVQFLRERYKALKDLKDEISGTWLLGALYCSLVGDFNGWSPTENAAREGTFGHDDYGYWFIILKDKIREGEEPDQLYFQQYNYFDDYDKGDSGATVEEIFKKANDEYWEPGEDRFVNSRYELAAKLFLLVCFDRWVVEYQIDGFYFHSLSSMMYTHNGFADFTGDVEEYCNQYVDKVALLYLILANEILHVLHPNIVTIAEDATLYPGLSESTSQGGLGFDYFVNLSAPEMWTSFLQNVPDTEWSMSLWLIRCFYTQRITTSPFLEVDHLQKYSLVQLRQRSPCSEVVHYIRSTIPLVIVRVEFPMSSNKFSYSLANRRWDLLEDEIHGKLFCFDKAFGIQK